MELNMATYKLFWSHTKKLLQRGIAPSELLAKSRLELREYERVVLLDDKVLSIKKADSGFSATCESGSTATARKVLLTTGLKDETPKIEGIERLYGRSVHHCPLLRRF
jgi:thioredoxin reductase